MVKLGDVCDFFRGLTYGKTDEVDFSSNIVLRSNNIELKSFKLNLAELKYISDDIVIPSEKRVKKGSLLICTANGSKEHLGKVALIDKDFNYAFGGFMGLLVPSEEILAPYLYYMMLSDSYKKYIKSLSDGANINNLKFKDLAVFELPLPPLEEQHRIVSILDASFEKIDALKKNAEENLKNAKALFQQVLAQELKPKEGWVEKKLGEVCSKIVDGTHHSPTNTSEGEYPYITAKNIKHNEIDLSNITYVTKDIHREIYSRCNPEKGDVLMIKDGATTGIAVVNYLDFEFSLLSSVALLKTKMEILDSYYLCYVLNSPDVYNQFRSKMDGAAITRITLVKIKDAVIQVPPLDQQRKIVRTLDTLSEKCRRLEQVAQQTIRECDALKQSILRQAFSGEL